MKKDRWKDLEGKYWEGKSSLEDERNLKAQDNGYFKGLESAKKEQMDWDFDDFVHQIESKDEDIVPRRIIWPLWKYIGIAVALFLVGFLFLRDRNAKPNIEGVEQYATDAVEKEDTIGFPTESHVVTIVPNEVEIGSVPRGVIGEKKQKQRAVHLQQDIASTEEAYVLVNGVPVYDEQEAEDIVMASLQLMVHNIQEGREAIEKMKYIKVKL